MTLQVRCVCGRTINVLDELAGRQARCLYCGAMVPVPGTPVAAPPVAAAPAAPSFHMLPPLVDHLNVARRLYGAIPRTMNPALHRLIDESMATRRVSGDPESARKALDEITEAVLRHPVVAGCVVRAGTELTRPGGRTAAAAVVFSTDPRLAFELVYLERIARKIPELGGAVLRDPAVGALRGPFERDDWDGCLEVPETVAAASPGTWMAAMVIDPRALPECHLATPFVAGIASPMLRYFARSWLLQV